MIVGDLKPTEEICRSLRGYTHVHVLGCGGCVTVCRTGGNAEAHDLARILSHPQHYLGPVPAFTVGTIERQCEHDLLVAYLEIPPQTDAILSLACGVGVQIVSDVREPLPVIPAVTTTFMGGTDEPGIWREKCKGCGDCLLALTASVCPISRCAKKLLNGPCGGPHNGCCEVDADLPCAWEMIYRRLETQGKLHLLNEISPERDWRKAGGSGPRKRERTGIALR